MLALTWLVALAHLALVVWLVVGGPLGAWKSGVARWHLAAIVPTAAVFLAGADCPLTTGEKWFLARGGRPVYEGGFIEHHLVAPLHPEGITPAIQLAIVAAWVLPTVAGHALRRRRAAAQPSSISSNPTADSTPMEGPAAVA